MKKKVKIIVGLMLSIVLAITMVGCEDSSDGGGGDYDGIVPADLVGTWKTASSLSSEGDNRHYEWIISANTIELVRVSEEKGRQSDGPMTVNKNDGTLPTITLYFLDDASITLTLAPDKKSFTSDEDTFTKQ